MGVRFLDSEEQAEATSGGARVRFIDEPQGTSKPEEGSKVRFLDEPPPAEQKQAGPTVRFLDESPPGGIVPDPTPFQPQNPISKNPIAVELYKQSLDAHLVGNRALAKSKSEAAFSLDKGLIEARNMIDRYQRDPDAGTQPFNRGPIQSAPPPQGPGLIESMRIAADPLAKKAVNFTKQAIPVPKIKVNQGPRALEIARALKDAVTFDAPGVRTVGEVLSKIDKSDTARAIVSEPIRAAKGFGSGVGGMVEGTGGAAEWLSDGTIGKSVRKYGQEMRDYYEVEDPKFRDAVYAGFGSMATFLIPGLGVTRGVQLLAFAPRLATWLGVGASSAIEALTEAGGTYVQGIEKWNDEKKASSAATKDFWFNLPTLVFTNIYGIFGKKGTAVLKWLKSASAESLQEFTQQVMGNIALEDPAMQGTGTAAGVGFIVGGGIKMTESLSDLIAAKQLKDNVIGPRRAPELPEMLETGKSVAPLDKIPTRGYDVTDARPPVAERISPEQRGIGPESFPVPSIPDSVPGPGIVSPGRDLLVQPAQEPAAAVESVPPDGYVAGPPDSPIQDIERVAQPEGQAVLPQSQPVVPQKEQSQRPRIIEARKEQVSEAELNRFPVEDREQLKRYAESKYQQDVSDYNLAREQFTLWREVIGRGLKSPKVIGGNRDLLGEYNTLPIWQKSNHVAAGKDIDIAAAEAVEFGLIQDPKDIFQALRDLKSPKRPLSPDSNLDEAEQLVSYQKEFETSESEPGYLDARDIEGQFQGELVEPSRENVGQAYERMVARARAQGMSIPDAVRYAKRTLAAQTRGQETQGKVVLPIQREMGAPGGVQGFGAGQRGQAEMFQARRPAQATTAGQKKATEAFSRLARASDVEGRFIMRLVEKITPTNEESFKKAYGKGAAGYQILGQTIPQQTQNGLKFLIEFSKYAREDTGAHEFIHGIRRIGWFRKGEWETLSGHFGKPGQTDAMVEESIANGVAAYIVNRDTVKVGRVRAILDRLVRLIRRLRNWAKNQGFSTAEDVMGDIVRGRPESRREADRAETQFQAEESGPVRAEFTTWQDGQGFVDNFPLYNIRGDHPKTGSTVGVETLKKLGIPVPETPAFEQWKREPKYQAEPEARQPGQAKVIRTPWTDMTGKVKIHTNPKSLLTHPDFKGAKAGDADAAYRLVESLFKPGAAENISMPSDGKPVIVVPVVASEKSGNNRIPPALAWRISKHLGIKAEYGIVQINKVHHTKATAFNRIINQAVFEGDVVPGAHYIVVDDVVTQGGTLANLKGFIESKGADVISIQTLTAAKFSTNLRPLQQTISGVESLYGDQLSPALEALYGKDVSLEQLTESELRTLGARSNRAAFLDYARNRSLASGNQGSGGSVRFLDVAGKESPSNQPQVDQGPQGQTDQTQTPEFKRWFGDSVVTDTGKPMSQGGKPLVVYHGSIEKKLTRFDLEKAIEVEGGFFFTSNSDVADQYTFERAYGDIISDKPLGRIVEAYLSLQNPLVWKTKPGQKIVDAVEMGRAVEEAKAKGHDGLIVRNIDDSVGSSGDIGDTYVAFEPTQIKSTGNTGAFDAKNPDIRYQAELTKAPIFYSQLQRTLEQKMPNAAPVAMVRALIDPAKGNVKAEEVEWSGINEWLAGKEKVTKAELLEFLKANEVKIEEVEKGKGDRATEAFRRVKELQMRLEGFYEQSAEFANTGKDIPEILNDNIVSTEEAIREYQKIAEGGDGTKFNRPDLVMPGGENYREVLLTWPGNKMAPKRPGIGAPQAEDDKWLQRYGREFKSSHFDEPNIVAHVRMNDRTTADGKKVLFLEEVQSDWHQQGRDKGYDTDNLDAAKAEYERLAIANVHRKLTQEEKARIQELRPVISGKGGRGDLVPDAPFKKTWHEMALKRMLRYAVDNGYDGIAWTTGEQQSERYWGNDLIAPAVQRFVQVTKPDSVRKLADNIFGGEMASAMPLEAVDGGVLAIFQKDQVRRAIIHALPVDVVNILTAANTTPKQFLSDPKVVFPRLTVDSRNRIAVATLDAIRQTNATLRAKLRNLGEAGGKGFLLPALKASDLNSREVAGLLSPESIFHLEAGPAPKELASAGTITEALSSRLRSIDNAKIPPAELAQLLNAHAEIIHGREGLLQQGFKAPPGAGMRGFYDQIIPSFLNKYTKKWGGRVGETEISTTDEKPVFALVRTSDGQVVQQFIKRDDAFAARDMARKNGNPMTVQTETAKFPKSETVHFLDTTPAMRDSVAQGQPMYQAEPAEGDVYARNRAMAKSTKGVGQKVKEVGDSAADVVQVLLEPISTTLKNAHPSLKVAIRRNLFNHLQTNKANMAAVAPFMKKAEAMSKDDQADLDLAGKNGDTGKINEILKRNGAVQEYAEYRKTMDSIRQRAVDSGIDMGYLDDYFPRIVEDEAGYLDAVKSDKRWPEMAALIKQAQADGKQLSNAEKIALINNYLRGYGHGTINIARVGNTKARSIDVLPPELNRFYKDWRAAGVEYIERMNKMISDRTFFGKHAKDTEPGTDVLGVKKPVLDVEESIGAYVNNVIEKGLVHKLDEPALTRALRAYFSPAGPGRAIQVYRDITTMQTIGNVISAITQLQDFDKSLTRAPIQTVPAMVRAVFGRSSIKLKDMGLEHIAEEFVSRSRLSKMVTWVLKYAGLTRLDRITAETPANAIVNQYRARARKGMTPALKERLQDAMGDRWESVAKDLVEGRNTKDVLELAFNTLLDFQPKAGTELPVGYHRGGNARIFYTLKTFQIRQLDYIRNEIMRDLNKPEAKAKAKAMARLILMVTVFAALGMEADALKDWLLGRLTSLSDRFVDNILKVAGLSKWTIYKARQEGLGSAVMKTILPPAPMIDQLSKDIRTAGDGKGLESVQSIPLVGKLYYWRFGRGREKTLAKHPELRTGGSRVAESTVRRAKTQKAKTREAEYR